MSLFINYLKNDKKKKITKNNTQILTGSQKVIGSIPIFSTEI